MHEWYIKLCHLMVVVGDVHEFLCHQTKIYLVGGKKTIYIKILKEGPKTHEIIWQNKNKNKKWQNMANGGAVQNCYCFFQG